MIELPIPTAAEVLPLLPAAAAGGACAIGSVFVRNRGIRAALVVLAAAIPWWWAWASTHGGNPPIGLRTSSERAALALVVWAAATAALPSRVRAWSVALRWALAVLCSGIVLWTFLDPAHANTVGWTSLAVLGLVGVLASTPLLTASRLGTFATHGVVAAVLGSLGLVLFAVSNAAALSQVVAATSIAASLTASVSLLLRKRQPISPSLPVAWLAAGCFAVVDAEYTADGSIAVLALVLFAAAIVLPGLACRIDADRGRSLRRTVVAVGLATILSAAAVLASGGTAPAAASDTSADPYGGLEEFK